MYYIVLNLQYISINKVLANKIYSDVESEGCGPLCNVNSKALIENPCKSRTKFPPHVLHKLHTQCIKIYYTGVYCATDS